MWGPPFVFKISLQAGAGNWDGVFPSRGELTGVFACPSLSHMAVLTNRNASLVDVGSRDSGATVAHLSPPIACRRLFTPEYPRSGAGVSRPELNVLAEVGKARSGAGAIRSSSSRLPETGTLPRNNHGGLHDPDSIGLVHRPNRLLLVSLLGWHKLDQPGR